jgi:hypothetical protein
MNQSQRSATSPTTARDLNFNLKIPFIDVPGWNQDLLADSPSRYPRGVFSSKTKHRLYYGEGHVAIGLSAR